MQDGRAKRIELNDRGLVAFCGTIFFKFNTHALHLLMWLSSTAKQRFPKCLNSLFDKLMKIYYFPSLSVKLSSHTWHVVKLIFLARLNCAEPCHAMPCHVMPWLFNFATFTLCGPQWFTLCKIAFKRDHGLISTAGHLICTYESICANACLIYHYIVGAKWNMKWKSASERVKLNAYENAHVNFSIGQHTEIACKVP